MINALSLLTQKSGHSLEQSTNIHFWIELPEIAQTLRQNSLTEDAAKL
jgi:hypothetical protein